MSDGRRDMTRTLDPIPNPETDEQRRWWNHAIDRAAREAMHVAETESENCQRIGADIERRIRGHRSLDSVGGNQTSGGADGPAQPGVIFPPVSEGQDASSQHAPARGPEEAGTSALERATQAMLDAANVVIGPRSSEVPSTCAKCGAPMFVVTETPGMVHTQHHVCAVTAAITAAKPDCTCWSGYLSTPLMVPRRPDCPVHGEPRSNDAPADASWDIESDFIKLFAAFVRCGWGETSERDRETLVPMFQALKRKMMRYRAERRALDKAPATLSERTLRDLLRLLVGHLEVDAKAGDGIHEDAYDDYHAARMIVGQAGEGWDADAAGRAMRRLTGDEWWTAPKEIQ